MTRTEKPQWPAAGSALIAVITGLGILAFGSSAGVAADPPKVLDTAGEWTGFAEGEEGARVCYAASAPTKKEGKYTSRGDVAMLVTHNMGDKTRDVVSVVAGYEYKKGEDVLVQVDEKKFNLFAHEDRAYAADDATDKAMVAAMKKGSKLLVVGTSSRDTRTTDVYSLSGFRKAYDAISKACPEKAAKKEPAGKKQTPAKKGK
ncbi:MAG: invasion associated locus B family protein [Alphaproteobacteria bacterium]